MASAAVQTAMNLEQQKAIHPFFKPSKETIPEHKRAPNETGPDGTYEDVDYEQSNATVTAPKSRGKRSRKTESGRVRGESKPMANNQTSLQNFMPRPNVSAESTSHSGHITQDSIAADEDPNSDRRKRQRTKSPGPSHNEPFQAQPASMEWHEQLKAEAAMISEAPVEISIQPVGLDNVTGSLPSMSEPADSLKPMPDVNETPDANKSVETSVGDKEKKPTPKKMLKVNKNGKLLSPGSDNPVPGTVSQKRTRGRKAMKKLTSPTVTVIKYGTNAASKQEIGQKINKILNGNQNALTQRTEARVLPKTSDPPKPTHPFFCAQLVPKQREVHSKETTEVHPPSPPRKTAATPGKLRAESRRAKSPQRDPEYRPVSGIGRITKQSGLSEASWPTSDTVHVRNLEGVDEVVSGSQAAMRTPLETFSKRKMKNNVLTIPENEDVVMRLSHQLSLSINADQRFSDINLEPSPNVRLPTRLLTTGVDIQKAVRRQVYGTEQPDSQDQKVHPAVNNLLNEIPYNLTPFDLGRCENQSWVQKYAPKTASHVLQLGKEVGALHNWLKELTIMAVEGAKEMSKGASTDTKKPPKKKRRKLQDEFIVDSDEEEEEDLVKLSDGEGFTQTQLFPRQRSLKRPRFTRHKNIVVISGPNGCGKSATVYAVAKELGFEVFEINPGSRRSGKDIQDKVGDMSENHLVSHKRNEGHSKQELGVNEDTENEYINKAFDKDLETGRQGTMTSFFKIGVPKVKSKMKDKTQDPKEAPKSAAQATLPGLQSQPKSQKQSLILFEEADVLFDEDQQFWLQIIKLAHQSKRPIIITCNDETQIPFGDLPLAAILRLLPPPDNLATDYMLALAGREGHILERQAVKDLYTSKDHDLRASITELNLWCQMSVGDKKGGLEWMYQRWPPGKDVDENGRLLRVASKDTYQSGMGWLSHDVAQSMSNIGFDKEEELAKESWVHWNIHPLEHHGRHNHCREDIDITEDESNSRLVELENLDALCDSHSAADIFCRVDMPCYESALEEPTDASLPWLSDKERLNFTVAAPLLQTDHLSDFTNFDTNICIHTRLLINRISHNHLTTQHGDVIESQRTQDILHRKTSQQESRPMSRANFSNAFDILACPPDYAPSLTTSYSLTPSSFDRTFGIITLNLAPYVRAIVSHELTRESERIKFGNLLSEGGKANKGRTTRASRTAMEGGTRDTKRRERWFDRDLNFQLVMETAGKAWTGMGSHAEQRVEEVVHEGALADQEQ